jgi:hypothetical protein
MGCCRAWLSCGLERTLTWTLLLIFTLTLGIALLLTLLTLLALLLLARLVCLALLVLLGLPGSGARKSRSAVRGVQIAPDRTGPAEAHRIGSAEKPGRIPSHPELGCGTVLGRRIETC